MRKFRDSIEQEDYDNSKKRKRINRKKQRKEKDFKRLYV